MALLCEHGYRFCVEFGVLNAVEIAQRDGLLPDDDTDPLEPRP